MPSLGDLLKDVEIDISDLEEKDDKEEIKLEDLKLDDIDEKHRPYFKKLIETVQGQEIKSAEKDLVIKTLKENLPKQTKELEKKSNKDEKILGVLDPDDPYAPVFKTLADMIGGITQKESANLDESWKSNVLSFAEKNKDIVKYYKDMDKIRNNLRDDSPWKYDVQYLYNTAKDMVERRENIRNSKKEEINQNQNVRKFKTETSDISSSNASDIVESKSIAEAFEAAEGKMRSGT